MAPLAARGACLCTAVRFEVPLPANWVAHCHCTRCQRAHGAGFVTWVSVQADKAVISDEAGALRWYSKPEGGERGFCSHCGSPLFFRAAAWPGELHVARAAFVDELEQQPQVHAYYDTHVNWVQVGDDLPRKAAPG